MSRSSCLELTRQISDIVHGSDLVEVMAIFAASLLATIDAAKLTTDIPEPQIFDRIRQDLHAFIRLLGKEIALEVSTGRIQ